MSDSPDATTDDLSAPTSRSSVGTVEAVRAFAVAGPLALVPSIAVGVADVGRTWVGVTWMAAAASLSAATIHRGRSKRRTAMDDPGAG